MAAEIDTASTTTTFCIPGGADDMHHHLRDGDASLSVTVPLVSAQFRRCIVMPNLKPPVRTVAEALAYRDRILSHVPSQHSFTPLMTLYLTDTTDPAEILKARESGHIYAVKYYPAGATTNSDAGVTNLAKVAPVLEAMAKVKMPLLVHGEVTDPTIDIFDREAECIKTVLKPLISQYPTLKVVMEHITTAEAVEFVTSCPDNVAATITPQHLLYNRNAIFQGGLRPHKYCLPVLKREKHRVALLGAIKSGSSKFFLGTDSAPHVAHTKEAAVGCAGIFSAHAALELYAMAFEKAGCLNNLRDFASKNGAAFYGLETAEDSKHDVTLVREDWTVQSSITYQDGKLVPLCADEALPWKMRK